METWPGASWWASALKTGPTYFALFLIAFYNFENVLVYKAFSRVLENGSWTKFKWTKMETLWQICVETSGKWRLYMVFV